MKTFATFLFIFIAALALAACGGEPASPTALPTDTATPTPAPPTPLPTQTSTPTEIPPTATETPAPTVTPEPPTATPSGPVSFVPAGQSVWEVPPAVDTLTGACSSSAINVPYGLIVISPEGNTLTFRDQGVGSYVFQMASTNVYVYNGRSNNVPGNLSMTLTFTSSTAWQMQTVTVLDADPTCQHNINYSAIFRWIR